MFSLETLSIVQHCDACPFHPHLCHHNGSVYALVQFEKLEHYFISEVLLLLLYKLVPVVMLLLESILIVLTLIMSDN